VSAWGALALPTKGRGERRTLALLGTALRGTIVASTLGLLLATTVEGAPTEAGASLAALRRLPATAVSTAGGITTTIGGNTAGGSREIELADILATSRRHVSTWLLLLLFLLIIIIIVDIHPTYTIDQQPTNSRHISTETAGKIILVVSGHFAYTTGMLSSNEPRLTGVPTENL
jgi:hypothetical protein